jgi:hypothetical protein
MIKNSAQNERLPILSVTHLEFSIIAADILKMNTFTRKIS